MKRMARIPLIRWLRLLALLPAALLLTGCAGSPTKKKPVGLAPAVSGSADELAANALLLWGANGGDKTASLAQLQKAVRDQPRRADLNWLYLRLCNEVPGCEPEPIEAQLRKLDPDNGVVWLGALGRAQARKDARAVDQILETMTKSSAFNVYWTTLIARLVPPLSRTPAGTDQPAVMPLTNAFNSAVSWLSHLNASAFTPVLTACDNQHVREPATRLRCDKISQALLNSDTTLTESFGLGIAERLAAPKSASAMQVTDRINTLNHQNRLAGSIINGQVEKEKFSTQMLKLMDQLPKEQDVYRAILRWAGQPLTP